MRSNFTLVFLFLCSIVYAQVGINTSSPADGTALHINENDKGILIPKVSLAGNNSITAIDLVGTTLEAGVLVYNTNTVTGTNAVSEGFYFWNGTDIWLPLGNDADWSLNGNDISNGDAIGTNNGQSLILKTNGASRFRITTGGRIRSFTRGSANSPAYSFENATDTGMYLGPNNRDLRFTSIQGDFLDFRDFTTSSQITFNPDGDPTMNFQIRGDSNVILNANPANHTVQIGANSTIDYASISLLHSDKGFLPNRLSIADLSTFAPLVSDPLDGLIAYNRSSSTGVGLYLWEGRWKRFLTTDDIDLDWHEAGTTAPPNNINDDIVTSGSVGIGGTGITTDASLDLSADDKGFMVNRVTLTNASLAVPITSPAEGMLVYNDTENLSPSGYLNDVRIGFYAWQNGRWEPQKAESRSARFGNAASRTKNLNDGTNQELELFAFNEWNDDTSLFTVAESDSQTRLTVNEDGRYRIVVAMAIVVDPATTVIDLQLDAELRINRSGSIEFPGSPTSNNYIRNRNGVISSSVNITETIVLESGDEVFVNVNQAGNNGTITMRPDAGSNFFTIEKIK